MLSSLTELGVQEVLTARPSRTVTASGVEIEYPFPSPADWRDKWIYFLLVDRFNNPEAPPAGWEPWNAYVGGKLDGVRERLAYLRDLGAGALWISPVLYNPQWFADYWGGYGISDLLHVDPRFARDPSRADEEFRSLVDDAHAHGLHVILDIVLNHLGDLFNYEGARDTAPWKGDGAQYRVYWRDERGTPHGEWTDIEPLSAAPEAIGPWPDSLRHTDYFRRRGDREGAPEAQGDFSRFKELVTEYTHNGAGVFPVRNTLIRAYQYLIARFDLDGYRIDTLQYVETDFARVFGNAMREYALSIGKRNFLTFGEVWVDSEARIADCVGRNTEKGDELIGVDAAIDFPMQWRLASACKAKDPPAWLASHFDYRRTALKKIVSSHGDAGLHYVTFLDNHDLNERFTHADWPDQTRIALTCLMSMQGLPCLYYGTEQGLHGHGDRREYAREALWRSPDAFGQDHPFYKLIQDLTALRAREPALRYGRQYFRPVSGDGEHFAYSPYPGGVIAFSRLLNDRELLVVANTNTTEPLSLSVLVDYNLAPEGCPWEVLFSTRPDPAVPAPTATHPAAGRAVQVTLQPMEAQVLRLAPPT